MDLFIFLNVLLFLTFSVIAEEIDPMELKCLVCRTTVDEMQKRMDSVDPKARIEVGYRLDVDGNPERKHISLMESESFMTDTLEEVCDNFDNYARARYKKTGRLVLLDLQNPFNTGPGMTNVDFIQDGDLNKSLKSLCYRIVDDNETGFLNAFRNKAKNIHEQICTKEAKYCDENVDYSVQDSDQNLDNLQNMEGMLSDNIINLGEDSDESAEKTEL